MAAVSEAAGLAEARQRIAACAATRDDTLDLGGLRLTRVPDEVLQLTWLKRLYLGVDAEAREKPQLLYALGRKNTDRCNALGATPGSFPSAFADALGQLELLDLGHNGITQLPPGFATLTSLSILDLRSNRIGETGAQALAALTGLTSLDLGNNAIGDAGARALAGLTGLTNLNLGSNQIGNTGAMALAALTGLTSLNLWNNKIEKRGVSALAKLAALTSLDLGNNGISKSAASALTALTGLTSLSLWNNKMGDAGIGTLTSLTSLTSLGLRNNQIGRVGAKALATLTGLTSLDLGDNKIGDAGARELVRLTGLTSLNLWNNKIKDRGASDLAALTGLTALNLWNNTITASGVRAFAALARLTSLDLADNQIGESGARVIAGLTGLNSLDLGNNRIGDAGVDALSALTGLDSLDLRNNGITDAGARAISPLVGLTSLDLRGNSISDVTPLLPLDRLQRIVLSNNNLAGASPAFWLKPSLQEATLYKSTLGDVPAELLSKSPYDNCLRRLQAHFHDLGHGAGSATTPVSGEPVRDIKVLVLGNGRIGKTQICRRLRGEAFVENDNSTHGVVVRSTVLASAGEGNADTPLHLWDFGGQDLYLGTHALFLRTRAIFTLVWTPRREEGTHEAAGVRSDNYPLAYWVRYVRLMAGEEQPLILTQSLWPGDRSRAPKVDADLLNAFAHHEQVAYSPKTDRARDRLDAALREAIAQVHRNGVPTIGGGRAWVKGRLEQQRAAAIAARKAGQPDPAAAMMTREGFDALCRHPDCVAAGGVTDNGALLRFLHDIGTVFAFDDDRIIVDLEWALAAIYAVFDRDSGIYQHIGTVRQGRFTLAELGRFLWTPLGHGPDEQRVFLDMMLASRIVFPLREVRAADGAVEYVAPDLLPDKAQMQERLDQVWDPKSASKPALFPYDLLPPGLLRSLMAEIGAEAGVSAIYWKDGFYFYDTVTRTRAVISQHRDRKGWSGRIEIRAQGIEENALLEALADLVKAHQDRFGIANDDSAYRYRSGLAAWIERLSGVAHEKTTLAARANETREMLARREPGTTDRADEGAVSRRSIPQPRATPISGQAYYMSYAWGSTVPDAHPDDKRRESAADAIYEKLKAKGIEVRRDRNEMQFGDRISEFMEQIAEGHQIVLILSKKYLRSPYCMYELYRIYEKCRAERDWADALLKRVQVWRLPCAEIAGPVRFEHSDHWNEQRLNYERRLAVAPKTLGNYGYREYQLVDEYAGKVSDILHVLGDQLAPVIQDTADMDAISKALLAAPSLAVA